MKKKEKTMLLWGLGGLAAFWFFTRPKASQPPSKSVLNTTQPTRAESVARMGLPYTYSADI